jgi:hypothetical protein
MIKIFLNIILLALFIPSRGDCQIQVLDSTMHNLRNGAIREWLVFPIAVKEKRLDVYFASQKNRSDQTLALCQYDVKQNWQVLINDRNIGSLATDEQNMMTYFSIPAGMLVDGQNRLRIQCADATSDDIKIGNIVIDARPLTTVLSQATVEIEVREANSGNLLPSRITIVNTSGILQPVKSEASKHLAIRPGVVYTGNGKAILHFPTGKYRVYAGRGFEYGIDSIELELNTGDHIRKRLQIKREVSTEGWVSCDTHIHTLTHSGHGDATLEERAITIAGEGIELPVLTEHNLYADLKPAMEATGVVNLFTPIVGDELTTKFGHFNIFKTSIGSPLIDHDVKDWNDVFRNVNEAGSGHAIILNHAGDIHNGFRPFGVERHLSRAGISKDNWKFPANAMEVMNSGSQQTNIMNLYQDWFGMLNHGYYLTPVGSSDSHDVSRYIVGQGRTYIQSADANAGDIDVDTAIKNFRDGKVLVSLGLLTKIVVNKKYGPGDIVPASNNVSIEVEVHGPAWTKADRISLYANGKKIREEKIALANTAGLKWKGTWDIPSLKHDVFLVAIAEGPGYGMPYWPLAKPYQPSSPDWTPKLIGSSGAVWVDADNNGKRNAAYDYAKAVVKLCGGDIHKIVKLLSEHDEAVAIQVAALLWREGKVLTSTEVSQALKYATPETNAGFETVIREIKLLE